MSPAPPISPAASVKGFPTSKVSHFAKVSTFFLINSEIFLMTLALSHGEVFFQTSKPFSDDIKAFFTSAIFAFDAFPIISSVAGLITS